jgi:hypothetical protein
MSHTTPHPHRWIIGLVIAALAVAQLACGDQSTPCRARVAASTSQEGYDLAKALTLFAACSR